MSSAIGQNKLTKELNQLNYSFQGFKGKMTFKRLLSIPVKIVILFIGLCFFVLFRALYPIFHFRFGELRGFNRIGEMSCRVSFYLRRCQLKELRNGKRDFYISGNPSNLQFFRMANRTMKIIASPFLLMMYRLVRKAVGNSVLWIDLPDFVNYHRVFDNTEAPLTFNYDEEQRGIKLLRQMGIGQDKPFVCFHARDKVYLDTLHKYKSREEWSYHDYRDCDVDNYLLAAEYLASKGIYVIRMGYLVEKKLRIENPYIIDYASNFRTDFGDIYLSAKCKFFICSEGGLSCVPWAFNVPVVYTNAAPIGSVAGWRRCDIFLPKKFWSFEQKKFLSFYESINMGGGKWYRTEQYNEAKVEMVENTKEEILEAVKEMNERLDGNWVSTKDEADLQNRYRKNFTEDHIVYGYPSRISDKFLRNNRDLL